MDFKKTIGKKVYERRLELGFSRKRIAELIEINEAQIGKIEQGISYPSIETLIGLKKFLRTDFDYFFEELDDNLVSNKNEQELFQLYKLLTKEQQDLLRIILRVVVNKR